MFGCPDSWVYCSPGSSDSSTRLDLRLSVWMFAAGRLVLRGFLGSHGTLVAVSAPFMMPLRDLDIPMNVPFTFTNKQPLHRSSVYVEDAVHDRHAMFPNPLILHTKLYTLLLPSAQLTKKRIFVCGTPWWSKSQ